MPDDLLKEVKQLAAERGTTFRAIMIDAVQQSLHRPAKTFSLKDASVGPEMSDMTVSNHDINQAIDAQRESYFVQ